jgi:hypothetical protein
MPREVRSIRLSEPEVRFENGTVVEAKAFAGEITQWRGSGSGVRSAMLAGERDMSTAFDDALNEVGLRLQETLHVEVQQMTAPVRSAMRHEAPEDRIVLRPIPAADGAPQVVLYQDESGGLSWHFPDGHFTRSARSRARGATFTISARTAQARAAFLAGQPAARMRGPITKLGRKIFKVIVAPLAKIVADPLQNVVGKIERRHRQDLIRGVNVDNYRKRVTDSFSDWSSFANKRSLLIIHGIFSSTEGMLGNLPPAAMRSLSDEYEGRVIAFDQLTVTKSPEENARLFLETAARAGRGQQLKFDILCHSRGGIVSRTLVERGSDLVPQARCAFDRVFFVATPNQGSPLGDAKHINDMLDVFTNLLTNFPDGPVTYSLEVLLAIVRLIAYSALAELPGIAAMGTNGYITKVLNKASQKSPATYAAAAANYEPDPNSDNGFFTGRFTNILIDRIFERGANDLVVPSEGVFAANGHPSFPIANVLRYAVSDHVWHTDFFRQLRTSDRLLAFFSPQFEIGPTTPVGVAGGIEEKEEDGGGAIGAREIIEEEDEAPSLPLADDMREMTDALLRNLPVVAPEVAQTRSRARPYGAAPAASPKPSATRGPRRRLTKPTALIAAQSRSEKVTLERHPHIDFHELVFEGISNDLIVSLSKVTAPGSVEDLLIDLLPGEEEVRISVSLYAPGFDVKPTTEQTMIVKSQRDPATEKVTFKLTARNPGDKLTRREITAEFWHRSTSIGSVTHYTNVAPKNYRGPLSGDGTSREAAFEIRTEPRQECDLIITVQGQDNQGEPPFRLNLRITITGEEVEALDCGVVKLPGKSLSEYFDTAIAGVLAEEPDTSGMKRIEVTEAIAEWNADIVRRVEDLGKQLWTFLPEKLRDKYLDLYKRGSSIRSIRVHSDEMIFPWELVVPHRLEERIKLRPLGIEHVIGRWKPGRKLRPSPQRIRAEKFVLLRPAYSGNDQLPWAEAEEAALTKLLAGIEVMRPANEKAVRRLFERTDVKLLHFSGHGDFNAANADLSKLVLENNTSIDVLSLANTTFGAAGNPIIYLNACGLGASAMTVGRAGGFANACIDGGYSGLLASYWAVNDASAARLSVGLYKKLLAGEAIGDALRDLRDKNRDDPAFLSCAYFGDPWTRLDLSGLVRARLASGA